MWMNLMKNLEILAMIPEANAKKNKEKDEFRKKKNRKKEKQRKEGRHRRSEKLGDDNIRLEKFQYKRRDVAGFAEQILTYLATFF